MSALRPKRLETGRWWDKPWGLVHGCTPVSAGCAHCWSEGIALRFRDKPAYAGLTGEDGKWTGAIRFRADKLDLPLRTRKPTVFAVWNDLFHESVSKPAILDSLNVMWKCHHEDKGHLFMVLTKRPARMHEIITTARRVGTIHGFPTGEMEDQRAIPPNVALGVTCEDQATADERIPLLLKTPARWRFVSYEPALGAVDFSDYLCDHASCEDYNLCHAVWPRPPASECHPDTRGLDLIIAGGESGPGARPAHPDWFRGVRDQCAAAGVPFLFKQWGEWAPCGDMGLADVERVRRAALVAPDGVVSYSVDSISTDHLDGNDGHAAMLRVGKKSAGRLLDGVQHNGWFGGGT